MSNSFLSVLRFPDFKKIWLSQVFSQIALNIVTYALVLHIFEMTSRATSISLVMIVSAIPVAIFGPFSGVFADKFNYRKIMIYTNLLRFFSALLLLVAKGNVLALLEIIFLISAISQFFTPAESSSVPLVVPQNKLVSANSVVMTTTYATLLLGYSLAGPLLQMVGPFWVYFICAILFLVATFSTNLLSGFDKKISRKISFEVFALRIDSVWNKVKDSVKYVTGNKSILTPMIKLTVGWTILGAFITLLPSYGKEVLNINPRLIGTVIILPAGVGMILGVLMLHRLGKFNHERVINGGFLVASLALLLFSFYHFYQVFSLSRLLLFVFVLIIGFGCSLIQVPAQTLLHLNSDTDKRGSVFGISSMQLRLATALPALVIGGVSDLTSPLITMMLLAVTMFIYAMILVFE